MRTHVPIHQPSRLLLLLFLVLLPLVLLFLVPGDLLNTPAFWLLLLVTSFLIWGLIRTRRSREQQEPPPLEWAPRPIADDEQPQAVLDSMDVIDASEVAGVRVFRGRLRGSALTAYQRLKAAFAGRVVPLIQEDQQAGAAIVLMPPNVEAAAMERPVRPWLHWTLFLLTLLTTTFVGAWQQGINLLSTPERFTVGLPYSLALLGILGCHELGHYFVARHHGMRVTPPFFIPVPFSLGTFGAFIQMRSPAENRRALFDVAVAGPLAGLVVALPLLYFGLRASNLVPMATIPPGMAEGPALTSSFLFAAIAKSVFGSGLAGSGVLQLSPMAYAGGLGLLVTALNLLPIGQLDGGHIARSLLGTRIGSMISSLSMAALFLAAVFLYPGLMMWAIVVFFMAGRPSPPLNDLTPLTPGRQVLAIVAFLILAMILLPMPESFLQDGRGIAKL